MRAPVNQGTHCGAYCRVPGFQRCGVVIVALVESTGGKKFVEAFHGRLIGGWNPGVGLGGKWVNFNDSGGCIQLRVNPCGKCQGGFPRWEESKVDAVPGELADKNKLIGFHGLFWLRGDYCPESGRWQEVFSESFSGHNPPIARLVCSIPSTIAASCAR